MQAAAATGIRTGRTYPSASGARIYWSTQARPANPSPFPFFVPGCTTCYAYRVETALIVYQDYHMFLLAPAGRFSYSGTMSKYRSAYGVKARGHNVLILDGLDQVQTPAKAKAPVARPANPSPSPHFVPGLPHVILIELRQAFISYQDNRMLLLTLTGRRFVVRDKA